MKPKIAMIGIVTSQLKEMRDFYKNVVGFEIELELDSYVEFKSEGVRFALTTNQVMKEATKSPSYDQPQSGQRLELAFPVDTPAEVDSAYQELIDKGAIPIKAAAHMPWNQRAAFFADPDGNIHEIFANL